MSTLSKLGAISGGIMGGMSMRQAMEQKRLEEERMREQMQWQREEREYRLAERERAMKEREAGDAYQAEFASTKFMQPGDPGKQSVMVPADPNAPDEPTMGVGRAAQTPRSEIAKVGMQEVFKQKPVDYRAAAMKDAEVLGQFEMKAHGLRGSERDRALSLLNAKKKSLIDGYTAQFPGGNPSDDPIAFSNYLTDVLAPFGAATMTPERAMQEYKFAKEYKDQATVESLELLQKGDKEGAIKLYCSKGSHCFADVILTDEDSKLTGVKSYNAIGIDKAGNRYPLGNVYDAMQEIKTRGKTAELAMQKAKMDADAKNAERDDARADKTSAAAINASNASATASYANAAQTKEETKWMRDNKGVKPGAGGGYKVEMNEVAQAFGTPAMDSKGKPITDLMTGRQIVNRNVEKENEFLQWMVQNGITDTNKGLLLYKGQAKQSGGGYDAYLNAFNKAKAAGNPQAMKELTDAARSAGIVK